MVRFLLRDALGFGFALWLFGYVLGMAFYPLVPTSQIGWWITPLGLAATLWTLWKWVKVESLAQGAFLGLVWLGLAVALDYAFIVLLLHPADGYYKLDVYFYYISTLALPILAAAFRAQAHR